MKRHILAFVFAAQVVWATPPTVSNVTFLYGSHSSVTVQFNISATGNDFRVRYIPTAQGSCDNGNTSATLETFGLSKLANPGLNGLQLPIAGLAPNTQYEFCPEVSSDGGTTWSTTGGTNPSGATFTTFPDPPVHPAMPIHPATFDTSYPDTTKGTCWSTGQPGYCTILETVNGTNCPTLNNDVTAAAGHQNTSGTVIEIPAGSTCTNTLSWAKTPADAIAYNPSNVSANTIALTNHGLSEGQGVVFGVQETSGGPYWPDPPAGVQYGYVYFVHVVDANDFQLYKNWEQQPGTETSGSNIIIMATTQGWASSPGISVGEEIVGSGIPAGTTITSIDYPNNALTLSAAATVTASGVTFTFGGPIQNIGVCTAWCTGNSGIAHFVPWPRKIPYWIIIRTSTPDSQFAPEGTRINPSWAPQMATLEDTSGSTMFTPYVYSTHIRFTGIEWTWPVSTEVASDPSGQPEAASTTTDMSDIIFDRNWFHLPHGDRLRLVGVLQGMDIGVINSYWDNLTWWHGSYHWSGKHGAHANAGPTPAGSAGSTSFTIPAMTVYYGAANPATLASTLTISWTGTPASTITNPEIAAYFDMSGALQISAPQGLTVTASAGTVSYTTTSATQNSPGWTYCTEGDAVIPVDAQGHEAAAPLGCVRIATNGTISGSPSAGIIYWGSDTEGCGCLLAGVGPGPYQISNNYISGAGILVHFDNGGGLRWRGDYLIRRNTFHIPMTYLDSSGNQYARQAGIPSDGYWYGNRQAVEWKGGQRVWMDGNIFDGGFADVNHGNPFDVTGHTGDTSGVSDFDVTNNTIQHYSIAGGLSVNYIENNGVNPPMTMHRYRAYNNLSWDINGFVYSTGDGTNFGVGGLGGGALWVGSGGRMEDVIFNHNTLYDFTNGMYGLFWDSGNGPEEGVSITNNVIPYGMAQDGQDLFVMGGTQINSGCPTYNEATANCAWIAGIGNPDYAFKGNLIIPSWLQPQYPVGGPQVAISTIQNDWPDYWAQNTIMNANGVANAFKAVGWQSNAISESWDAAGNYIGAVPNFRLLSGSLYNHGQTTDGKPEGADISALEAAQGKVTLIGANLITSSSATINYVAPDSGSCSVDFSNSDPTLINSFTRVQDAGGARARNVSLTGLASHTVYNYRVNCQVQQPVGRLSTN